MMLNDIIFRDLLYYILYVLIKESKSSHCKSYQYKSTDTAFVNHFDVSCIYTLFTGPDTCYGERPKVSAKAVFKKRVCHFTRSKVHGKNTYFIRQTICVTTN